MHDTKTTTEALHTQTLEPWAIVANLIWYVYMVHIICFIKLISLESYLNTASHTDDKLRWVLEAVVVKFECQLCVDSVERIYCHGLAHIALTAIDLPSSVQELFQGASFLILQGLPQESASASIIESITYI